MKKSNKVKSNNHEDTQSLVVKEMNLLFLRGDFYLARKKAATLINSQRVEESAAAKAILKMTKPDTLGLLAGFLCLLFSSVVGVLVAY